MKRCLLDSSVLISYWKTRYRKGTSHGRPLQPKAWAQELINLYHTDAIVTPVAVEFLAGFTNGQELQSGVLFLAEFQCVDREKIPAQDWKRAKQIAGRIPRDNKRRQLGDCLIRAIADRLRYDVLTRDLAFPR